MGKDQVRRHLPPMKSQAPLEKGGDHEKRQRREYPRRNPQHSQKDQSVCGHSSLPLLPSARPTGTMRVQARRAVPTQASYTRLEWSRILPSSRSRPLCMLRRCTQNHSKAGLALRAPPRPGNCLFRHPIIPTSSPRTRMPRRPLPSCRSPASPNTGARFSGCKRDRGAKGTQPCASEPVSRARTSSWRPIAPNAKSMRSSREL